MRDVRVLAIGLVALVGAWLADRWLWDAYVNTGAFAGGNGTREMLLAADRIPKLALLLALGWIALDAARDGIGRASASLLLVVGATLAAGPPIVLLTRFEPLIRLVADDLYLPRQFVMWTATGLLIVGLVGLALAGRRLTAGPWLRASVALVLLALTWPADAFLSELFIGAAEGRTISAFTLTEMLGRVVVMAALVALVIASIGTRPDLRAGVLMVVAGAVAFIGFALANLAAESAGVVQASDGVTTGYFGRWLAAGVVLLGLWELWLARLPADERAMPEPMPDSA